MFLGAGSCFRGALHGSLAIDGVSSLIVVVVVFGSIFPSIADRVKIAPLNSSRNTPPLELQTNK